MPINEALALLPETVNVLAEPGRFIVAQAVTECRIHHGAGGAGRRSLVLLDDGIYGSFSGLMFDHVDYPIVSLKQETQCYPSVLAGPTCDSIDVVAEHITT
ncbi:hypothetical protein P4S72_09610 [Vibrio sp. PP-XX7]